MLPTIFLTCLIPFLSSFGVFPGGKMLGLLSHFFLTLVSKGIPEFFPVWCVCTPVISFWCTPALICRQSALCNPNWVGFHNIGCPSNPLWACNPFMLAIRWSMLTLFTYLTPKLSTTNVNVMGLILWYHNPGVFVLSKYPNGASFGLRRLFASMPTWGNPQTACCISKCMYPFSACFSISYCLIIHGGNKDSGIWLYSKYSKAAVK